MPVCSKCGEMNPSIGGICKKCGADLPTGSEAVNPSPPEGEDPSVARLLDLLRSGQKIAAIKAYREEHGVGLKEAKDAVEALAAEHGIASKPAGCSSAALLFGAMVFGMLVARWVGSMV